MHPIEAGEDFLALLAHLVLGALPTQLREICEAMGLHWFNTGLAARVGLPRNEVGVRARLGIPTCEQTALRVVKRASLRVA